MSHRIVDADGDPAVAPLTALQLGELLGRSRSAVYGWHRAGTGPRRVRVGIDWGYLPRDVEAWLNSGRTPRCYRTDVTA